ncbi:MAG TPA: CHAT domain-containing tetratricopeptide repeat protein [Streptosporangiaceae bacterium]|nr:CHAT domain-containing tetratricopeptide repeat protein [Streptosporangiaceae bacterium]
MVRARYLAQVRDRVRRFDADKEPATVLADEALAEVLALVCSVPDPVADLEVAQAAGLLFLQRVFARGSVKDEGELTAALDLLAPVYRLDRRGVPDVIRELFDSNPREGRDGPETLARLGRSRFAETLKTDDDVALDTAISLFRRAVAGAGAGHSEYGRCRTNLGSALLSRFERAGSPADLDEAIALSWEAVSGTGPDEPDLPSCLSNLGNALLTRFEHFGSKADLDAAIEAGQAAVTGWPDHPDHAHLVSNLDLALRTREAYLDRVADLDKMIEAARDETASASLGEADRVAGLSELGDLLLARFHRSGDPADLDEAVQAQRDAADAAAPGHPDRAECLSDLSYVLRTRFVETGNEQDLADAVTAGRAGLAATPAGDPNLGYRLSSLANALYQLSRRTGSRESLDEAVTLARQAAAVNVADDLDRAAHLSNLCNILRGLFEHTGQEADLDEAIGAGRAAIPVVPPGHPELPGYLGNLGAALLQRFRRGGRQLDLDESVTVLRRAVLAAPEGSPDRVTMLASLGAALRVRFDSARRREDLDEAIDACRDAVLGTPREHSSRAARLSTLGVVLQDRFGITGSQADIDEAVAVSQSAIACLPPGHPRLSVTLSNYALVLRIRHGHTGSRTDLDESVDAARAAVTVLDPDHPDRAMCQVNLGQTLRARFAVTGSAADLDMAFAACQEAAAAEAAPSRVRVVAAGVQGSLAAEAERWQDAVACFAVTVDLLGRAVPRSLSRHDQEFLLDGMGDVGSDAAACCVRAGQAGYGIELLEQGRGLLLSQALDTRTDLTALTERYPDLAGHFTALSADLDLPGPLPGTPGASVPTDEAARARRAAAAAFDQLITEIREKPGFGGFLRPPVLGDLAPEHGYIAVVNVSRFGSHALILSADADATAVPLPKLSSETAKIEVSEFLDAVADTTSERSRTRKAGQQRITRTLGWLWEAVAEPVLNQLNIAAPPPNGERWPRLWWCPSGLMSFLPLHAAGHHDTSSDTSPSTVIDRVVSSTTPTIRALAHARRAAAGAAPLDSSDRAVVVSMPRTPGISSSLPGADTETSLVSRYFPGTATILRGMSATYQAVTNELPSARWAHFACHGHSDLSDPSSSHLLLADHQDQPLTVADLARLRIINGELAFLSACSTARPGIRLANEAIHLASAFQLAGYSHVIGTLWPIGDRHAVQISDDIYKSIIATGNVAQAVHSATRHMRDQWPSQPSIWASHIHVGP